MLFALRVHRSGVKDDFDFGDGNGPSQHFYSLFGSAVHDDQVRITAGEFASQFQFALRSAIDDDLGKTRCPQIAVPGFYSLFGRQSMTTIVLTLIFSALGFLFTLRSAVDDFKKTIVVFKTTDNADGDSVRPCVSIRSSVGSR